MFLHIIKFINKWVEHVLDSVDSFFFSDGLLPFFINFYYVFWLWTVGSTVVFISLFLFLRLSHWNDRLLVYQQEFVRLNRASKQIWIFNHKLNCGQTLDGMKAIGVFSSISFVLVLNAVSFYDSCGTRLGMLR